MLAKVIAPADAVVNLIGILAEVGGQRFDQLQAGAGRIGTVAEAHDVQSITHISAIGASDGFLKPLRQKQGGWGGGVVEGFCIFSDLASINCVWAAG